VKFEENIRGTDVFIIQSTNSPPQNFIELLLILDAARRASAYRITAVIPYYGYARQDRKDQPRVPISARLFMDMVVTAGANRILCMDLHSTQIQGFVNIPFDHLYSKIVFIDYLREMGLYGPDVVIISPDVGSVPMARSYARLLGSHLVIVDKRRISPNSSEIMNVIGDPAGKTALIIDDLVDTGGTLVNAANAVMEWGAQKVYAACTHPVLSGNAIKKIETSPIEKLIVTDTLNVPANRKSPKLEIVSVSEVFGEAIQRIHNEESVSTLFDI
jgi:ribose-phosphate pyrophosphokinase